MNNINQKSIINKEKSKVVARYHSISGFAHLFLLFLVILVAIGGLFYYSWQKGLLKTPSQVETSPTPTISIDETENWKTYRNEGYNFSIQYPPNSYLTEEKENGLSFYISTDAPQTTFEVTASKNYSRASDTAKLKMATDKVENSLCCLVERKETTFQGVAANKLVNLIEGPETMSAYSEYLIFIKSENEYVITITTGTDKLTEVHKFLTDQILSTFQFMDEDTFTYSCIPKFEVESDTPELSASQLYSQKCFEQKTKEGCLAVDIYRESTKNFGNSDGIGDCEWKVQ